MSENTKGLLSCLYDSYFDAEEIYGMPMYQALGSMSPYEILEAYQEWKNDGHYTRGDIVSFKNQSGLMLITFVDGDSLYGYWVECSSYTQVGERDRCFASAINGVVSHIDLDVTRFKGEKDEQQGAMGSPASDGGALG